MKSKTLQSIDDIVMPMMEEQVQCEEMRHFLEKKRIFNRSIGGWNKSFRKSKM